MATYLETALLVQMAAVRLLSACAKASLSHMPLVTLTSLSFSGYHTTHLCGTVSHTHSCHTGLPGASTSQASGAGSRVGYHVRLDASMTRATRLLFCTTGILLRRLGGDLHLPDVSHIIVDEVTVSNAHT